MASISSKPGQRGIKTRFAILRLVWFGTKCSSFFVKTIPRNENFPESSGVSYTRRECLLSMSFKKSNPLRYVAIAFSFLLLGTFLSPILTCGNSSENPLQLKADGGEKLSPAQTQAVALEDAFQEVFDRVSPSVVSIATERTVNVRIHPFSDPYFDQFFGRSGGSGQVMKQKQYGLGSGIVLNEEGYIMTNHHVIQNMDKFTVKLKNKKNSKRNSLAQMKLLI